MKTVFTSHILLGFFVLTNSCQSHSVVSSEALPNPTSLLSEMNCEQLIAKANSESFSLKGLAGIRAHKNCKDFKFNFDSLSGFEKKLYSEEIEDSEIKKNISNNLSINELKDKLAKADKIEDKLKAYKALRAKYKGLGQRNDYLKTTADLFNWSKKEFSKKNQNKNPEAVNAFYDSAQLMARTYWTEDRDEQAEKILTDSLRLLKGLNSVAEIYFLKARINEENEKFEEAIKNYDLAIEDIKIHNPKNLSFTTDRLFWTKAWVLYKLKNWESAEKAFQQMSQSTLENSERSKALFFQARCLNQLNKKEEAKKILEKITQDDFFSFYGLVSYNELGLKFPALNQIKYEKKFPFDTELSFLPVDEGKIFKDLITYKEVDLAEKAVPLLAKNNLDRQINVGAYLAEKGQRYLPLFAAYAKLDNSDKIEVFMKISDLLFPQPHLDDVKKMSEKTQIPVSLIYSIMKQESAFNPKTRSHADAMGLMQMIPRLAKHISKKFDVNYTKPEDLFRPEINIQLGTFELMEQVKKQSGQLTYVAAAYNAGPNALANWLKSRKRNDIVEFIEEIPYEETRTYVKIIARNKLFYERISKRDEAQSFPIEFLVTPVTD